MYNKAKAIRILNKRPLFIIAFIFALGIILGRYFNFKILYIITAAVFTVAAVCFYRKKVFILVCAAFMFFAAFLSSGAYNVDYVSVNDNMRVVGRVYSQPYQNDYGSTIYFLDQAQIDGTPCGNIKLYISNEEHDTYETGDIIEAKADVQIPKGVRNPGGFDEKLYLLSQGVHYKAYADSYFKAGIKGGLPVTFSKTREHIGQTIDSIFEPDIAPVAKAMLLGDKQGLDEQVYSAFKDTGVAHILAVSGLHAAILIAFIYYLLKLLRLGRKTRLIVTLLFITLYACVTGLTPSILRASIMAAAILVGKHFGRQTDTLNYLSLAFVLSLIINPLDFFSAGFALSFGAVFGILTIGWQINYWLNKKMHDKLSAVRGAVSVSAGATAGTMPVLASMFNRVSTFGIITNIFVIPLASAAIVLVFISTLAGLIFSQIAVYLAYVAGAFIRVILFITQWLGSLSFAALDIASPPWYFILACFALMFICSKYLLIKTKIKAVLSAVVSAVTVFVMLISAPGAMYLVFLDVGQADAAFIKTQQGGEYFIDGGGEYSTEEIVNFTIRNGYTPEAAFVSHTDSDHFSGIVELYKQGLLGKVYCSWQERDNVLAAMPNAEVVPLGAGDRVLLDDYTQALVLYPYKDSVGENSNENSLVLLVEYNGHTALFTGDISGQTETQIFADTTNVDIYKAAHHGSKYSSYQLPLSGLLPEYSVVSVGSNQFGHPHEYAMSNLQEFSENVYTTMDNYAIEFYIDDKIKINTYCE